MIRFDYKQNTELCAQLMKQYQEERKLTLREMESHFDFSYGTVKRLMRPNCDKNHGIRILAILAHKFNRPITDFFTLTLRI